MSKAEQYARQSARAVADIAAWPEWMRRNLTPTTIRVPHRIQRKRTKGWRMPEGAVYVGRPTRWGNPFRVGDMWLGLPMTAKDAYQRYHNELPSPFVPLGELRGRDLVCWCPLDQPCHADVLLELANR